MTTTTSPLATLSTTWTRVTVTHHNRYDGRAQMIVKANGHQRTVSFDYSAMDQRTAAIAEVFGPDHRIVAADGKQRGAWVYWVVAA